MGSLAIRSATALDADKLASVHAQSWRETYRGLLPDGLIDSKEERMRGVYESALSNPGTSSYWVATWDGEVVGLAIADALGPGDVRLLEVKALYVLYDHQRKGIGSILLNHAVGTAPCLLWVLEGNEPAIAFYRGQGFELDGEATSPEVLGGARELRMVR